MRKCTLREVYNHQLFHLKLREMLNSFSAKNKEATIVVRVGNNRPDLGVNPICNRFTGVIEEGRPLFLPCNPPMPGAFVSIHFEGEKKKHVYIIIILATLMCKPFENPHTLLKDFLYYYYFLIPPPPSCMND